MNVSVRILWDITLADKNQWAGLEIYDFLQYVIPKNLDLFLPIHEKLQNLDPELRFCAGSNPAGGVSEIRDGEDL